MIDVAPSLRKARTAAGESAWLDSLPELVSEMASQWSLSIGRSCDGFGMNALVLGDALPAGVIFVDDGDGTAVRICTPAAGTSGTSPRPLSRRTDRGPIVTLWRDVHGADRPGSR